MLLQHAKALDISTTFMPLGMYPIKIAYEKEVLALLSAAYTFLLNQN